MIQDKIRELEKLQTKHRDLLNKLDHSLMIKKLWKNAFDNGNCKTRIKFAPAFWNEASFILTNGNGVIKSIPLKDTPIELISWNSLDIMKKQISKSGGNPKAKKFVYDLIGKKRT